MLPITRFRSPSVERTGEKAFENLAELAKPEAEEGQTLFPDRAGDAVALVGRPLLGSHDANTVSSAALWSDPPAQTRLDGLLGKSPGFSKLSASAQTTVQSSILGEDPYTRRAQRLLGDLIEAADWSSKSPTAQSTALQGYLSGLKTLDAVWYHPLAALKASPAWSGLSAQAQTVLAAWLTSEASPAVVKTPVSTQIFQSLTDPRFQALSPRGQADSLARMMTGLAWAQQMSSDPLGGLQQTQGWAALEPEQQALLTSLLDPESNVKVEDAKQAFIAEAGSASFLRKNPDTQHEALGRITAQQELARRAWTDWVGAAKVSAGFEKLHPLEQTDLLRIAQGAVGDDPAAMLARLVRNSSWPRVRAARQADGLRGTLALLRDTELKWSPLNASRGVAGWSKLAAADRMTLETLDADPAFGNEVAAKLRALFQVPGFRTEDAGAQAAKLHALAAQVSQFAAVGADPEGALNATSGAALLDPATKADLVQLARDPAAVARVASSLTQPSLSGASAASQAVQLGALRLLLQSDALSRDVGGFIAGSKGYAGLTPEEKTRVTDLAKLDPALTEGFIADVKKALSSREPWSSRSATDQAAALRELVTAWKPKLDIFRDPLAAMTASPAWAHVPPRMQERLSTVTAPGRNALSPRFRSAVAQAMMSPEAAPGAGGLAQKLTALLSQRTLLPSTVEVGARPQTPFVLDGPTLEKAHAFQGLTQDADVYVLHIRDHTLKVYAPHQAVPSKTENGGEFAPLINHTIQQVGEAFSGDPDANLKSLVSVTLSPGPNPQDDYWARAYDSPNFVSYMTSGAGGEVSIYPIDFAGSAEYMASSSLHESGHSISQQHWGEDSKADPRWKPWHDAVKSDVVRPSDYGASSFDEDVAESIALYQSVRDDLPLFEEYRKSYPARFKILDGLLGAPDAPVVH